MKRVLCFIVVLAIAASMCIGVLSVSADGEATLILSKTVVRADAGSISLEAKITGAATYETWLGIFAETDLNLNETDSKTLYQGKNSGWVYAQNVKSGDQLDKELVVPDGTIVDLSTDALISPKEIKEGKYRAVMFRDDNLSGATNGFEVLATAEFEIVMGSEVVSNSSVMSITDDNRLGQLWFHGPEALYAQTFSSDTPIQAINIPAWVADPAKPEIDISVYAYNGDIPGSLEGEPIYTETHTLSQANVNLVRFDEPLAAGEYVLCFQGKYGASENNVVLVVSTMDIDVETYSEGQLAGGPVLPSADPSAGISMQLYTEKANAPAEVLNPDFGEQSSEPTDPSNPSDPEPPAETGDAQIAAVAFAIVVLLSAVIALTVRRKGEIG